MLVCNPEIKPKCGPKVAWKYTVGIYLASLITFWVLLPILLLRFGVRVKFYLLDLVFFPIGFILPVFLDVTLRKKKYLAKIDSTVVNVTTLAKPKTNQRVSSSLKETLLTLLTIIVQMIVMILYPILIIPLYRSTTDKWRLVFVCGIHPLLQEFTLTMMRLAKSKSKKKKIESVKIAFEGQMIPYMTEYNLVLTRRIMLSWMKNKKLILLGILITGVEEAILRVSLTQRDRLLQKFIRKQEDDTDDRKSSQNTIWTASICHSMIAEHVAIIVRWAAVLMLPVHRYVFDLGYEDDISRYSRMSSSQEQTILFAFFIEWLSEIVIDRIAVNVEFQAGVPLEDFFKHLRKTFYMTGSHIFGTLFGTTMCLWTFTSIPTVLFCSKPDNMCTCDQSAYPMYASILEDCAVNETAVLKQGYNLSFSEQVGHASAEDVETDSLIFVLIAVVIFLAVGAVASQALAWSKRKEEKEKMDAEMLKLEQHNYSLKASVEELNSVSTVFEKFEKEKGIIHIPLSELTFKTKLGAGSFGTVVVATLKKEENVVAVKILDRLELNRDSLEKVKTEIRVHAQIKHPNIVKFLGASWDTPPNLCIVLEYLPGGDLRRHLRILRNQQGFDANLCSLAMDVARALAYMHNENLIHRDVKPDNVLLTAGKDEAKLADLGEARFHNSSSDNKDLKLGMTEVGTPYYLAPEILRGEDNYNFKVDVYSFGIMLNEMDTKRTPYSLLYSYKKALVAKKRKPSATVVKGRECNCFFRVGETLLALGPRFSTGHEYRFERLKI